MSGAAVVPLLAGCGGNSEEFSVAAIGFDMSIGFTVAARGFDLSSEDLSSED